MVLVGLMDWRALTCTELLVVRLMVNFWCELIALLFLTWCTLMLLELIWGCFNFVVRFFMIFAP